MSAAPRQLARLARLYGIEPGYRDIWGNVVIARAAAHPWGAQRLLAYLTLSGLFDRFPNLRIGFAECSAGWLPAWRARGARTTFRRRTEWW